MNSGMLKLKTIPVPKVIINKRKVPVSTVLPAILSEIINDEIKRYCIENNIIHYTVEYGYIQEYVSAYIETAEEKVIKKYLSLLPPSPEFLKIENVIFNYFHIDDFIYIRTRKRKVIRYRQIVQFFAMAYSKMTLDDIALNTGIIYHATLYNTFISIISSAKTDVQLKNDLSILDDLICMTINQKFSNIFNDSGEIYNNKFKKTLNNQRAIFPTCT